MIKTVFENNSFLAVEKSAGWLTVPGRQGDHDLRPCLSHELRERFGNVMPVHRLDVEVSGLVLFARNSQAHRMANHWFEQRQISKLYEAWTEGSPVQASSDRGPAVWASTLLRGKKRAFESPHGKPALTHAWWLGTQNYQDVEVLLWRLQPLTGRSHQLRFELAKRGFPILGDALYGAKIKYQGSALALRATCLNFTNCDEALGYGLPAVIEVKGLADV